MKKYIRYGLIGVIFLLYSCYEDKGTYSYGEINEMTLRFSPATTGTNEDLYIVPQPAEDTLYFELTPVVAQSQRTEESNLEYRWLLLRKKVDGEEIFDTTYVKTFTFKFAPGVTTNYDVLFSVRDKGTGVEHFRRLKLKSIVPYIRNWLILHGRDGDRKIAALEYDSTGMNLTRQVEDIYYEVNHERRFQHAFAMTYISDVMPKTLNDKERLYLLEPDNCYWLHPFTCEERANKLEMMPDGWDGTFKSCFAANTTADVAILDEAGGYFHCGAFAFFYPAKYKEVEQPEPHIDQIYTNVREIATLWDNVNKRFMYYHIYSWNYAFRNYNRQHESDFSDMQIIVFPDSTMQGIDPQQDELAWLGHGITNNSEDGSSAIFRNLKTKEYKLFNIRYAPYTDKFLSTEVRVLSNAGFEQNSRFAVTSAFSDQLFYSSGTKVYLYNTVNNYTAFLYSVGDGKKITKLAFRMSDKGTVEKDYGAVKVLGIGVETANGEGEFHELFLDESGDVVKSAVYRGLGSVVDFCYTYVGHAGYEL